MIATTPWSVQGRLEIWNPAPTAPAHPEQGGIATGYVASAEPRYLDLDFVQRRHMGFFNVSL